MPTLRQVLILGLCLCLIASGCSAATPAPDSAPPAPTSSPQPALPTATLIPTPEPAGVGIPVIEFLNDRSQLRVVSSVSGRLMDSFKPISFGGNYSYAFAPDGRTLALVSEGELHLIDLPTWKYRTFDIGLHGWLSAVQYNPDGSLLALASGDPDAALLLVDAQSGGIEASAQAGFAIRNVEFTSDGQSLMVFGPQIAATGVAANAGVSVGAPKAALYAAPDLRLIWSVKLNGVRHGVFPKKIDEPITQDIYQPGAARRYEPGVAFDPNRDLLFVVHGDEDKLTTVDFAHRKLKTMDVHVKTGWLDWLLSLTAGVAHAKGMDGTTKRTVISPDGKYLYSVGSTESYILNSNGNVDFTQTFLGLQIIATKDGALVDQKDVEADMVASFSNGGKFLITGWKYRGAAIYWTEVYDADSGRMIKHFDHAYLTPTRRMDGKAVLVSNEYFDNDLCTVTSIDPAALKTVGEWKSNCAGWLAVP